jgi:hypothetical protein
MQSADFIPAGSKSPTRQSPPKQRGERGASAMATVRKARTRGELIVWP